MQFKLHVNGNLKAVKKAFKDVGNRPALLNATVELYDLENVRLILANGFFLSDIKVRVTDMEDNPLKEAPHDWLAVPLAIFYDVKPQKARRYSLSDAHYVIEIDAESQNKGEKHPMLGTAKVQQDGKTLTYQLGDDGLHPQMLKHVIKRKPAIEEVTEDAKQEWLKGWNGFVNINFNVEYLLAMLETQRGTSENMTISLTVDAFAASMHPKSPPPVWVQKVDTASEYNIGLLMPVMSKGMSYEQDEKYLGERSALRDGVAPKV